MFGTVVSRYLNINRERADTFFRFFEGDTEENECTIYTNPTTNFSRLG